MRRNLEEILAKHIPEKAKSLKREDRIVAYGKTFHERLCYLNKVTVAIRGLMGCNLKTFLSEMDSAFPDDVFSLKKIEDRMDHFLETRIACKNSEVGPDNEPLYLMQGVTPDNINLKNAILLTCEAMTEADSSVIFNIMYQDYEKEFIKVKQEFARREARWMLFILGVLPILYVRNEHRNFANVEYDELKNFEKTRDELGAWAIRRRKEELKKQSEEKAEKQSEEKAELKSEEKAELKSEETAEKQSAENSDDDNHVCYEECDYCCECDEGNYYCDCDEDDYYDCYEEDDYYVYVDEDDGFVPIGDEETLDDTIPPRNRNEE